MARDRLGVVVEVIGRVVADAPAHTGRVLAAGDVVYTDETLIAAPDAYVRVRFVDGTLFDLADGARADLSVYASAAADVPQAQPSVAEIQALLREGGDPTAAESGAQPTAAGPAGAAGPEEEGGHTVLVRAQDYVEVDPFAGIPTAAEPLPYPDVVFDPLPIELAEAEPPEPVLVVGSSSDDQPDSQDDHVVPRPGGPGDGPVTGGAAGDILIGDPGGSSLQAGQSANLVFVLDTSGSMSERTISFDGGTITRQQALQQATIKALGDLYASDAENVRVHIVQFNTGAAVVGTFDLIVNGVPNAADLESAIAAVEGLPTTTGATNYEAGLLAAQQWVTSGAPLAQADVNKVLFVSDGEPTRHYRGDGSTEIVGAGRNFDPDTLAQLTGADSRPDDTDTGSEIGAILGAGYRIEAVGISVGGDALDTLTTEEALDLLDQIEGAPPGDPGAHAADNIATAEELSAIIGQLTGAQVVTDAAGNDLIVGGDGDDVIFGDVPQTDALADAQGLTTLEGAGWLVIQQLEAGQGSSADWSREDTLAYLRANHAELAQESGRDGGHDRIFAGAGSDIVYGQEGDDLLVGGAGDDLLAGGSGADTFAWRAGDLHGSVAGDVIADFDFSAGDRLDVADLLSGYEPGADISGFLKFEASGADTAVLVDVDGGGDGFRPLALLQGVAPPADINALLGTSLVVAHETP
jgi:Ca2+-binding RTX toxin-like protein